ncbi:lipopolysaccharide heptosyltransferase II [Desulfonema magnum]|uniref:lipopolysaccharide heptosyltransferase II n=1 Tax=Desulfonema magnum TaxID=45655 RepID=UPI001FE337EF|nr:lipopolysaccharide heptosyltransferase II [Desulfonema magnum]
MKSKLTHSNLKNIRHLLIRSTNWIGDAIMTTPAVRAIRKNFPGAEISILAKSWVAPVFKNSPHADRVLIYDEGGRHCSLTGKLRLATDLKRCRFDAVILLQNAFEAALITFLAGIPVRIGFDSDARKLLLTHAVRRIPEIRKIHQTGYYLEILRGAGLMTDGQDLHLTVSHEDQNRAREILVSYGISQKDGLLVGINPGATFGTAKRWFPERYAALCKRLQKTVASDILIFGGPGEEALGQQICEEAGKRCVNLCGRTTLCEAMALIERCQLFVTNDSGLMHIAAALDIPQIAIFGSTDHVTTAPVSSMSRIVRVPTSCSPCLRPECPEKHHRCMNEITVDMVESAVYDHLSCVRQQCLTDEKFPCILISTLRVRDSRQIQGAKRPLCIPTQSVGTRLMRLTKLSAEKR